MLDKTGVTTTTTTLVADDDPDYVGLTSRMLQKDGYQTITVLYGVAALAGS